MALGRRLGQHERLEKSAREPCAKAVVRLASPVGKRHKWPRRRLRRPGPGTEGRAFDAWRSSQTSGVAGSVVLTLVARLRCLFRREARIMRMTITREQRDAIYQEVIDDLSGIDIFLLLSREEWEDARRHRRRFEDMHQLRCSDRPRPTDHCCRHPQRPRLHGRWRHRQRYELGWLSPHRLPRPTALLHRTEAARSLIHHPDQPSQAFFPRDREIGGDLDKLTDTDRENTRRLYELTFQVVQELGGALQVIALDHADFEDDWFAGSVVQRWREGEALIPTQWLHEPVSSAVGFDPAPSGR
jgi:hypothetical protein